MIQYIPKSDLAAEIKRLIDSNKSLKTLDPTYYEGLVASLDDVLSFLDTLEVKEVDLEKEAENFVKTEEFVKNENPVLAIAKHFFELGLGVQSPVFIYKPSPQNLASELGLKAKGE